MLINGVQLLRVKNKTFVSELGLVFITIIWGSAFVVVKNATASLSASYIIAIRFGLAAILMAPFFFTRLKRINLQSVRSGAILAVILYTSYYLQTVGVKYTTAGNNAFLTAIYGVMVPFLSWIIRRQKPDGYNIVSAFVCIAGIGVLSLRAGFSVNIGDVLTLLSGILFGLHIVYVSILTENNDPILLSFTQFAFTAIIAFAVAGTTEQFPARLETGTIFSLLYIGIFSTMIAMIVQLVAQRYVPPSRASLIMSLESLFGSVFGILFLNEPLTPKIFVGFLLIFSAILLSETKPSFFKRSRAAVPEPIPIEYHAKKEER